MEDTADDDADEHRATNEVAASSDIPQDVEWGMVVQKPVGDEAGGLTTTIVYAVAEAEGIEPVDVKEPPLYDVVDTTALESAFFRSADGTSPTEEPSTTEFMYRGHRVVVRSDGWVFVYDSVEE